MSDPTAGGAVHFLGAGDVLALHEELVSRTGGLAGIRDLGLLESAVMMPQARFGGAYLHEGRAAMAATYLFHICRNHPFVDGNKRAGAAAALAFLVLNGAENLPDPVAMEQTTAAVAEGSMSKEALIEWFRAQTGEM